ncbi:MAG: Na+/H+ antiporter NhaA [Tannerella sp.]|jgi:NhaA family Na+:H+ antiporter|nr:Na+/H+ antiporter NhaA [Tannerella sp.]
MSKPKTSPIDLIVYPIQRFMRQEKAGGIMLGISVILALFLANSAWSEPYFLFLKHKLGLQFDGKTYLEYDILHWVNDGLMAIFFFVVGLELKREFVGGELSNPRKALLPIGAAIGGMVVPAVIYFFLNPAGEMNRGWGIPMATDIAFSLGVLYLLGDRIPLSLKVFLTALAIVDDLGAVLVIAFFYTSDIYIVNLFIGFVFITTMYIGNKLGIRNIIFYAILGIGGVWTAFLLSGVHATIASVAAAFTIPADVQIDENTFITKIQNYLHRFKAIDPNGKPTLSEDQLFILDGVRQSTNAAMPPLQRLEVAMHPFVIFIIIPIFALANAGVSIKIDPDCLFNTHIAIGAGAGLLFGKFIGVVGATLLMVKLNIARFPRGMTTKNLCGIGFLTSIGFTMSLFITSLAFTNPEHIIQAKIGIFAASIIGGVAGYILLRRSAGNSQYV